MMYRIYEATSGHEFGIDYPTLVDARAVKAQYAAHFPRCRYYIRKG